MKGENKSCKRYSSCVTLNHCLLTFLIVISCVNYSHGFWDWVPSFSRFWRSIVYEPCPGEFECQSQRLCAGYDLLCDGINDCDDGSDELTVCEGIPQILKADFICGNGECPRLNDLDPSPSRCGQGDFSNIHLLCNYQQGNVPLVVFSTLSTLYETSLPEDDAHVNKALQFYLSGISAFHYDNYNDYLIWLDTSKNKIYWAEFRASLRKKGELAIIKRQVSFNVSHKIHGFVYDWEKNVLIWVDDYGIRSAKLNEGSLTNPNKLYRNLDPSYNRLGSITIDVEKRYIFWTNIGANPSKPFDFPVYIERIDIIDDEPEAEKIVETNILRPVGLAIDTRNSRVYWIDGLYGTLESVGYDGTNRITLSESLPFIDELISMDIFSNYLYFTDNANSTIQRININNAVKKVDTLISVPNGPPTWVKIIEPRVKL